MEDFFQVLFFVVVALAVGVSVLVKRWREAQARAERDRQIHPRPSRLAPPPVPPHPGIEPYGGGRTQAEAPAGISPLEEFRKFMEQVQGQAQTPRRVRPVETTTVRRVQRPPVPVKPVEAVERAEGEEGPSGASLSQVMAEKDVQQAAARTGPPAPVPPTEHHGMTLRDILASNRSDLAKAVLFSELLGRPVAFRSSPVPWHRK